MASCREETFTPKPRGYFDIHFPKKEYQLFNRPGYPFQFEYPVYAVAEKDSMFFDQKAENPWWLNLLFDSLNAKVYLSYKEINATQSLAKLLEDSYFMSHYHSKKADYINEPIFHTENNVHGLFYEVGGNAASAFQFYATDSHKHFVRGALYFNVTPNADSLRPMNAFLVKDMEHFIQTLKWTR
jgi:gliding motility-associated lipoprotein GldD